MKNEMGSCPKCGSDNLDYVDYESYDDSITHKVVCKNCGLNFCEYEKTVYDGYSYIDEEGLLNDFDEEGNLIYKEGQN